MAKALKNPVSDVAGWLAEIEAARKREKHFREEGERILKIYDGSEPSQVPFNILYSNTETLLPALYSATPRPIVQRRYMDDDPLGKASSEAGKRMLTFLIDTNLEGYDPFDRAMRGTVLDALLPGRGSCCVSYDAQISGMPEEDDQGDLVENEATEGAPANAPAPVVESELVCLDTKGWTRVYYGYAKKWSKVPWIAFEEYIDQAEATRLFGSAKAEAMTYSTDEPSDKEDDKTSSKEEQNQGARKTACIYQIWDRSGGNRVKYVSTHYPEGLLKDEDDPLGLSGFFPCPRPLSFYEKTHSLIPTALYHAYENQATELNRIQNRINAMVQAIRVKALYDSSLSSDLSKLMAADDLEWVPTDSASSLAAEKGMSQALFFMPLDVLQAALDRLYAARDHCKQVIYEITGISDILRGASQASETATAQNIKNQWGTLRLKRLQKEVARYAVDLLRLMLNLAANKFSEETWAKMTGLPYLTALQAAQSQQLAAAAQQQAQQTGQPIDPAITAQLQQPTWQGVLALLKDDLSRAYRIDVETNSTVEPSATEDQKNISDLMMALAQYLQGVAPLIAKGVLPFQVAQSMMLAISRRFQFGSEIEDYLKQMVAPPPEGDGGKAAQAQQQAQQQQMQGQQQLQQAQVAQQMKALQDEKDLLQKKVELELRELALKAEEDKFTLMQQVATEKLAMRDQVHAVKTSATDQVRSLKEASSKKVSDTSVKAEQNLAQSAESIQAVTTQMAQMNGALLHAVQMQAEQTQQVLGELKQAITAPRKRKAIRGTDGKIEAMEESLA